MASTFAQALFAMLLIASMVAVSTANKDWQQGNYTGWGFNRGPYHLNKTEGPNKIIVGGSENWHYGFNYADWSLKNASFYVHDTLVFKYDPPNNTTPPHSVYMLPNLWSFIHCDLSKAKMVGSPTQGGGNGFEFVLKSSRPYYFACGEHNGTHCKDGMMRFFVFPKLRGWHY
ncbi:putative cupredoxin [Rosa chinensis]|uniref:Putative cupredoxin n=1 Tax=Rosa chinensis TaxID=74649 RepID=A0A2P6PMS7_ROSCH|nr:uncharacterized protein LOC112173443 [Rosa chinensis]PRQ23225.1 putative cupredoxin [Rosa chinensis]